MSNPCDRVSIRAPKAPGLKEAAEILLETRPATGGQTVPGAPSTRPLARPPIPGESDTVMPLPNPLAVAAGEPDAMGCEPDVASELERSLPAMAQRVIDLLSLGGPALDSALSAMAAMPADGFLPMGGRLGRAAAGEDPGHATRAPQVRRPSLAPHALAAIQPPLDLTPPIEPSAVEPERLADLGPPPAPGPLAETLKEAHSTPWTPHEGERFRLEAPAGVTMAQVQVALRHLPELEAFVGGALRMATDRCFRGFSVSDREGFSRLAGSGASRLAGPVGAYLVALNDLYGAYKADHHGLARARRALLDRRDPAAPLPLLSESTLEDYLWRKYGAALRSRLWRLVRTSVRPRSELRRVLGGDRHWRSGGAEPSFELVRAGAFVALKSAEGDLELQKEQGNPWSAQGVFNLAVAIRLGRDVVAYDVRSGVLRINRRVVPWSEGVYELPEGGRLELGEERFEVVSLRGDTVRVLVVGRSLDLSGTVSGDRPVDSVMGSLGAFGLSEPNAWIARDGCRVDELEPFLASWQVLQAEALD